MHVLARASEIGFACEIGGLYDERVSLPMAARVPHPLANTLRKMRPTVHRDDAGVMDLLIENHDVAGNLHQSKIIVVAGGCHWRTAIGSHNTTLGHRAIFGALSGSRTGLVQSSHSLFR